MKNILITGSTDGIGKLAAIQLAKKGNHIYLHGRNEEKLKKVIEEVKAESKNENVDGFVADFSILKNVEKMTKEVIDKMTVIDILINNAGIFKSNVGTTVDGLDIRFAVNYFAPYILTKALLPLIRKSDQPRIINLSSAAQLPVALSALKGESSLSTKVAYAQSKLALTMWSTHLADQEQEIIVIPVNPGSLLNTKMVKEAFGQHWSPADKGANIMVDLATKNDLLEKSGTYYDNDQGSFGQAHADAYDALKIEELLKATEEIVS